MEKPDLNKMWRTWVKIGFRHQLTYKMAQDTIRNKMYYILQLQKMGEISWFYFLFHNKRDDPVNTHFDLVFTSDKEDPSEFLPEYCIDTKKIPPMKKISGIDMSLLKDEDIAEAWKIIGEQSVFIIELIRTHKANVESTQLQIAQFMHYFMNSLLLGHKSILFFQGLSPQLLSTINSMQLNYLKDYVPF
ncbi:MAG: hypothetical protein NWF13_02030 [Candidatus Bathyarchaeota archaeon]|nr:hypothetical protein [Candidatus Bathyarchaeota archaeon]